MPQTMYINPESELSRQLKEAAMERRPLRLVSGATVYEVEVRAQEVVASSLSAFDPARFRQALARSADALRGVDLAALKRDVRAGREQDSLGRPV